MKTRYLALAAAAALAFPGVASAATLVSAAVFGNLNNTVWATANAPGSVSSNYTLFLQNPGLGNYLNANDEAINVTVQNGINYAFLAGDGYFPGQSADSDPIYNLELTFDNGSVLRGSYTGATNTFLGGSPITINNQLYTLTDFSFRRNRSNPVGPFTAVPLTGDGNDYAGNYNFSVTAVPEPATWAMMLVGVGMIGFGLRGRRKSTKARVALG